MYTKAIEVIYKSDALSDEELAQVPLIKSMSLLIEDAEDRGLEMDELKRATNHYHFDFSDTDFIYDEDKEVYVTKNSVLYQLNTKAIHESYIKAIKKLANLKNIHFNDTDIIKIMKLGLSCEDFELDVEIYNDIRDFLYSNNVVLNHAKINSEDMTIKEYLLKSKRMLELSTDKLLVY